ncbi:MAG: HNH endonuclease [Planctomycetes bacterium]|nr:HNH endonuclease [Planctomycetota bacterium]
MSRLDNDVVLTLNRIWQPIATTGLRKAMNMVFRGRARVVDADTFQIFTWDQWLAEKAVAADNHVIERDYLRTATLFVRKPQVVTLARYAGYPNRGVPYSRRGVYERDSGRCQFCLEHVRKKDMTVDHILPQSRGGRTNWTNCVLACAGCNHRKADRLPHEVGMKLVREPFQPTREQLLLQGVDVPAAWRPFLDA